LDRVDAGYSPLWNLLWATAMPINYSADQFSNAVQGTVVNGLEFFRTPMYVNCPNVGLVGETNRLKSDSFESDIVLGNATSFIIIGTSPDLILVADQTVMLVAVPSNTTIGEVNTNMMGGYEYSLESSEIPNGTTEIQVMYNDESIRTITVEMEGSSDGNGSDSNGGSVDSSDSTVRFISVFVAVAVGWIQTAVMMA
jgi:hypothetical protein